MAQKRDYYEVLEVSPDASPEDIKRAYRRLARQHHPDVCPGDPAAEGRFKEIAEAYEVLSDPQKRYQYDQFGHLGEGAPGWGGFEGFGGFGDLFDAFFGARQAARTQVRQAGADLRYDLEISLEEAARGADRTIRVSRLVTCTACAGAGGKSGARPLACPACQGTGQVRHTANSIFGMQFASVVPCGRCRGEGVVISDPCPTCHGRGTERRTEQVAVRIPAGADSGSRVRLAGKGDAGMRSGPAGDLYVLAHMRPHEIFERRGTEIICEAPLAFTTAALGGKITVPTLDGQAELRIPPGTQPGTTFRLKGKGLPDLHGAHRGDQHVVVRLQVPTQLNEKQRRLLEAFRQAGGDHVEDDKSLFDKVKDAFGKQ